MVIDVAIAHCSPSHTPQLAASTGDNTSVTQAARHVALAEAVCKLSTRAPSSRPSPRRAAGQVRRTSDFIDSSPHIQSLLALSSEKHPQLWSFQARSAFVQRVDATPDQVRKASCNSLLHRQDDLDALWCGMSDGYLRIYRIPVLDLVSSLPLHKGAITTACSVQKTVWSAGRDGRLVVVDAKSFHTVDELPLDGQVVMQLAVRGTSVYGVTGQCMLLRWDAPSRQLRQKIDVSRYLARTCILTDVALLNPSIWIACGSSLAILDIGGGHTTVERKATKAEPRQNLAHAFNVAAGDGTASGASSYDSHLSEEGVKADTRKWLWLRDQEQNVQ